MARKAQNVRRRGNSWVIHFRVSGKQTWRSFADRDYGGNQKASREAAELFLAQSRAQVLRFCEEERGCKPSTLADYRLSVEAHLRPALGHLRLEQLTPGLVEQWKGRLLTWGLAPRTANKLLTLLHGVCDRHGAATASAATLSRTSSTSRRGTQASSTSGPPGRALARRALRQP